MNISNDTQRKIDEIWRVYQRETSNGLLKQIFEECDIPFSALVHIPVSLCFGNTHEDTAKFFLDVCSNIEPPEGLNDIVIAEISKFREYLESGDIAIVQAMLKLCAEVYVDLWTDGIADIDRPKLPSSSSSAGAIIDLASGPEVIAILHDLRNNTDYYFIDSSYFVCQCISYHAARNGYTHVKVINKSIMELERCDIDTARIHAIRARNVFSYVPDYVKIMGGQMDWLDKNGEFILAHRACRPGENEMYKDPSIMRMIIQQISKGYDLEYRLGDVKNPESMNELIFIRDGVKPAQDNIDKFNEFNGIVQNNDRYNDAVRLEYRRDECNHCVNQVQSIREGAGLLHWFCRLFHRRTRKD